MFCLVVGMKNVVDYQGVLKGPRLQEMRDTVERAAHVPINSISNLGREGLYRRVGKRAFDVLLALALLPFLGPLICLLWGIARLDGGSGFFGHERVGRDGRRFKCWKIRTMVPGAEEKLRAYLEANPEAALEWEAKRKLANDPRITPIGNFLRVSSLDELPQILNVLAGDMSFVGPRPVTRDELRKYGRYVGCYLAQTPGITGGWQVSGRNDVSYDERVAMDRGYLNDVSFLLDLQILLKTWQVVIRRTGC